MSTSIHQIIEQQNSTINFEQSRLLREKFLDTIGSKKGDEVVFDASYKAIVMLAGTIIGEAQKNLNEGSHISTGELSDSLQIVNPVISDTSFSLQIQANFYYKFLNSGVRGTRSGNSAKGYAFKNEFPSKRMVSAIRAWMVRANLSTRTIKKKTYKSLESKNVSISDYENAYAMARTIKIFGIKKTGFYDKAVVVAQRYSSEVLSRALRVDVMDSLPNKLSEQPK